MIVAHGGDTLSPSVMSGLDHGAHIIALTNMIAPDIFAPGNHEFDFGKAVFLERMGEATFPLYGANLRDADGAPLPGFKDRAILDFDGVRIGLTGLAYEQSPRMSSPEDLRFASTVDTTKQQAAALRARGRGLRRARCCTAIAATRSSCNTSAPPTCCSPATPTTCSSISTAAARWSSPSYDAHYVTCIDVAIAVREDGGKRTTTWWPQFRVIDTATVTPDPEVAAAVARFEQALLDKMTEAIGTTAVALDSSTATVRTREAAIGNLFADAMRAGMHADAAIINGGGIRAGKIYEPGARISQGDILAELPFNNRVVVLEISGRDSSARWRTGSRACRRRAGAFRRSPASRSSSISRARRAAASSRCRSAARRSTRQDLPGRDRSISWRAAATTTRCSATPAAHAGQRRADDGQRGGGLSAQARHGADRRRGPDRGQVGRIVPLVPRRKRG